MDIFTTMKVYCSVVENDSLADAARKMNVSPSVVSKHLSALEDHLGVRLLNRTTRRLSITEEGAAYYERCKQIITDVAEAEIEVSSAHTAPRGLLKNNRTSNLCSPSPNSTLAKIFRHVSRSRSSGSG